MSNKRFLECSSFYRDRNIWPYPAEFDVLQSLNNNNVSSSTDPILSGANYFQWNGGQGVTGGSTGISVGTIKSNGRTVSGGSDGSIYLTQTNSNPIPDFTPNNSVTGVTLGTSSYPYGNDNNNIRTFLSGNPNYYNGYRLRISGTGGTESRIINGYNISEGFVTVSPCFSPGIVTSGSPYIISDPSESDQIHVPTVDVFGYLNPLFEQGWETYKLVNYTKSTDNNIVSIDIKGYFLTSQLLQIDKDSDQWDQWDNLWEPTDYLSLVKNLPVSIYRVENLISSNQFSLPSYLTYGTGHFNGKFFLDINLLGTSQIPNTPISNVSYNNNNDETADSMYLVTDYSGAPSNIVTYSPFKRNEVQNGTDPPTVNSDSIPGNNTIVSLAPFLYNNSQPILYSGSIVSQNEPAIYEVACISLLLPNVVLTTGSRIAQYGYVYVSLTPLHSSGSSTKNVIYSNNPNSNTATFCIPIKDTVQPLVSAYVRVDSGQMVQTLKIKPNDSFHFRVFLPTGQLFTGYETDNPAPYVPWAPYQITGIFSFSRIVQK